MNEREALTEATKWLHAAYDRPPQTPEAVKMLELVDEALSQPSPAVPVAYAVAYPDGKPVFYAKGCILWPTREGAFEASTLTLGTGEPVALYAAPQPTEPAQPATQAGAGKAVSHPLVRDYEAAAHCLDYAGNNEDHREASQALRRARDALNAALATTQPPQGAEPSRDAERLDWLEQRDRSFYNIDKIAAVVGTGFMTEGDGGMPDVHQSIRKAIDAARAAHGKGGQG